MARIVNTFDPVERFVVGTVGQPGERSFFLQARSGARLTSVLLEKTQVTAIADRLEILLRELRRVNPSMVIERLPRDERPLDNPIVEEFRVGIVSLSWLSDREVVSVELQAVNENFPESEEILGDEDPSAPDLLRVILTPSQTDSFVKRAAAVVNAGRPPCPFCGLALDPQGHVCPRSNGYRR
jgi:uncharacterized repeat protein (TIGR03847 family)